MLPDPKEKSSIGASLSLEGTTLESRKNRPTRGTAKDDRRCL